MIDTDFQLALGLIAQHAARLSESKAGSAYLGISLGLMISEFDEHMASDAYNESARARARTLDTTLLSVFDADESLVEAIRSIATGEASESDTDIETEDEAVDEPEAVVQQPQSGGEAMIDKRRVIDPRDGRPWYLCPATNMCPSCVDLVKILNSTDTEDDDEDDADDDEYCSCCDGDDDDLDDDEDEDEDEAVDTGAVCRICFSDSCIFRS